VISVKLTFGKADSLAVGTASFSLEMTCKRWQGKMGRARAQGPAMAGQGKAEGSGQA
jgi:hypothetical protein